ncbi:MAG: CAP domain-containing protein [Kofleriaceae bacterium]
MRAWILTVTILGCRPAESPAPLVPPRPAPAPAFDSATATLPPGATPALARRTALDRVAAAAAESASLDHVVSARSVHAAMAAQLGSGMWPHVLTGSGSEAEIGEQLQAALDELRATVDIAEIGIATAEGPAGRVGVIVALPLPLLPIEVGRGSATSRISMPWIWSETAAAYAITSTMARRIDPAMLEHIDQRLELAVDCTKPAAIEIRAGTRIVATVVDACATAIDPEVMSSVDVGPPANTRIELERRVFELLNRERVAHDRPPLAWDEAAHRFARHHAVDMATYAYVGHEAPDGASLHRRVDEAPFRAAATRENVGHAWGPGEVHDAFMASPGHRENALAWDVTRGAVGIERDRRDPRAFYVTEFFRRP